MDRKILRPKSIRLRLLVNFILIILIAVILMELLIINIVKQNYYRNMENNLVNQVSVSSELYSKYFSDSSLYDNVLNNVDTFWRQATAEVQIIDLSGKVLMDSLGVIPEKNVNTRDVQSALKGEKASWTGLVSYDSHKVMAVSSPLMSGDGIVGVLRFVASLKNVDGDVNGIAVVFIFIGIGVIIIAVFLSVFMSNSMVRPLKEVSKVAVKMASGDLDVRSIKKSEDEIGQLSDILNFMADEIQSREKMKNDFIASVSHELRTPLTSIKGWAVTLREGGIDDETVMIDGLEIIEKESDRLSSMVEELLDFSKLISGKIVLRRERVDIEALMENIRMQLLPRTRRDELDFSVECEEGLQLSEGDNNRLRQVFINLLDNAIKYTQQKGSVSFKAFKEDDSLIFVIKDTGVGISPDELPKVREKFYKARNSKPGNGLGLSICDEIVKQMGGYFEISSELNKGTEVKLVLPAN